MNDGAASAPTLSQVRTHIENGSFEDALAALEAVVDRLERGQLPIDEALAWYEAGLGLSRRCVELLEQAELRISTLDDTYRLPRIGDSQWSDDEG